MDMRLASNRPGRIAVAMAVVALVGAACGGGTPVPSGAGAPSATPAGSSAATGPGSICELAYVTGEFAPYGPALSADVVFPVKKVINLDPPLGRQWVNTKEDLGTVGEAQAARTCLDKDK